MSPEVVLTAGNRCRGLVRADDNAVERSRSQEFRDRCGHRPCRLADRDDDDAFDLVEIDRIIVHGQDRPCYPDPST